MSLLSDWFAVRDKEKSAVERYQDNLDKLRRKAIADEVNSMSFVDQMMVEAGHETDKLLSGAADIGDSVIGALSDTFGDGSLAADAYKRQAARAEEQQANDEAYSIFNENSSLLPRLAGGMLPYIVSGSVAGPIVGRATSKILGFADDAVRAAAKPVAETTKTLVQRLADMEGLPGKLGQKMITDFRPYANYLGNIKNSVSIADPWYGGVGKRLLGDVALGGIEGGTYYDNAQDPEHSAASGALASGIGSLAGNILRPVFHKAASLHTPDQEALVKEMYAEGAPITPGMWTGNPADQKFEANLRGDSSFSPLMKWYDRVYDKWRNNYVAKLMGIPKSLRGDMETFSPQVLRDHLSSLGSKYNDAYDVSIGTVDTNKVYDIMQQVADLKYHDSPEIQAVGKQLEKKYNHFYAFTMDQYGNPKEYGGRAYQNFRTQLKSDIDKAIDRKMNGDYIRGLKAMKNTLDDGVNSFVPGVTDDLADLDAQYAITSKMLERGAIDSQGNVNMRNYINRVLSEDAKDYLAENGNERFKKLYRVAKLEDLRYRHAKGGLFDEKTPMENSSMPLFQRMINHPGSMLPGVRRPYLATYMKGYPHTTGLLNWDGTGLTDVPLYTRAFQQSAQTWPWMYNNVGRPATEAAIGAAQSLGSMFDQPQESPSTTEVADELDDETKKRLKDYFNQYR